MARSLESCPPTLLQAKAIAARPGDEFLLELVSILLPNRVASREFIDSGAKLFHGADFERALDWIPDVEPEDYDRF